MRVNKCQCWFRRLVFGDFDLSDRLRNGRPVKFDSDTLKFLVESDPHMVKRDQRI